jgi:hypothetical protein
MPPLPLKSTPSGRHSFEVIHPLYVRVPPGRPRTRDDQLAHHGGLRATVIAIKAHDYAVVFPRANVFCLFCEMEQRVVHLERKRRRVSKHIAECNGRGGAGLDHERSLWLGRDAGPKQREGVLAAQGRADGQHPTLLAQARRFEQHVQAHLRAPRGARRRRHRLVRVEVRRVHLQTHNTNGDTDTTQTF